MDVGKESGEIVMRDAVAAPPVIIRTERGLTIAGTRTTVYAVMDYLQAAWPPDLIQHWLMLSEAQLDAALTYIARHQEEVETEYQTVLRQAQESRAYWETQNQELLARIATRPPPPGREALHAKIRARKADLGLE